MINKNTVLLIAIIFGFWIVKPDTSLARAGKSPIHVGFTSSIIKDVQGQLGSKAKRKLIKSDQVYFNENLITSEDSIVVVQFRDGSTLELGPDALMTLDEMIFNPFKGKSIKVVTLLQGTFRYVSGYAAKEAQITIKTAAGTIGIRGSAGSGFYYPGKPAFIHVAKGSATFSNKSGSTNFSSGGSIASLSQVSPLMNPTNMPATVVAEALSHVQASLGKPIGKQPLTAKQQKADAIANAIPIAEQGRDLQATEQVGKARPSDWKIVTPDLPLLDKAANAGFFTANDGAGLTQKQKAFIAVTNRENPKAEEQVARVISEYQNLNFKNISEGTTWVVKGSSANAKDAKQIGELMEVTISANPKIAKIASSAAIIGGSQNATVEEITEVAEFISKGAILGATQAGADILTVTQIVATGAVSGAALAGQDILSVSKSATKGAIAGAVAGGGDISLVTKAVTQGSIIGATDVGSSLDEMIQSVTKGAMLAAEESGLNAAQVIKAATQGAIAGGLEGGSNVEKLTKSITQAVSLAANEVGLNSIDFLKSVSAGITEAASGSGSDASTVMEESNNNTSKTIIDSTSDTVPIK